MTVASPIKPYRTATFDGITISTKSKPAYIMAAIRPSPKGIVISYDENWNHEGEVPMRSIEIGVRAAHKMFRTITRNQGTISEIGNGFFGSFEMMGKTKYFTHAVHVSPEMMPAVLGVIGTVISPKKDSSPKNPTRRPHVTTADVGSIASGPSA